MQLWYRAGSGTLIQPSTTENGVATPQKLEFPNFLANWIGDFPKSSWKTVDFAFAYDNLF